MERLELLEQYSSGSDFEPLNNLMKPNPWNLWNDWNGSLPELSLNL